MSDYIYLARQPIFDKAREIFAYELFYRNEAGDSTADNPRFATSTVLVNLLNQIGTQRCVGDKKAFVNIDATILLTDIISSLPKDLFIFEVSEQMVITNRESEAIAHLHRNGYTFALDNVCLKPESMENFSKLIPYMSYAKFDATRTDVELLASQIDLYKSLTLIVQKVEFSEMVEAYEALGFSYFQGNFFAQPVILEQQGISPKHLGVIRLYNMLQNEEPVAAIAEEFHKHNELSMQLLQFINSADVTKGRSTSSIREAIEAVGIKRLQLWLLLIIYSKSGKYIENDKSPFSLQIQKRIDIMLALLPRIGMPSDSNTLEQIRFIAFLSLIEEAFGMPLASVMSIMETTEAIEDAVLNRQGELGRLLGLAEEIETSHIRSIRTYLKHFGLTIDDISDIIATHQQAT